VFADALNYDAAVEMPDSKIISFNSAMQFVELAHDDLTDSFVKAAQRCSLVHAIYSIVAEADSCGGLSDVALENGSFHDVMVGGSNQNAAWCLRARHYGNQSTEKKAKRYAARSRSMKLEREALEALTPMLSKFGGRVNLQNPDCKIYVFDGLLGTKKVLARRLATGPQVRRLNRMHLVAVYRDLTTLLHCQKGFHHGPQHENMHHKHTSVSECGVRNVQCRWSQRRQHNLGSVCRLLCNLVSGGHDCRNVSHGRH
jgi:hypothetical protein